MTTNRAPLLSSALTRVFLLLALLTAAMIGLGFLVTHVLVHVWPLTLEDQGVRALVATRTPTLDRDSNMVSLIAYTAGLAIVMVAVGGVMRIVYHRWREAFFLAAAMLAQFEMFSITSRLVHRARPPVAKLDVFPPMESFPSGHTAAAVALYGGIAVILAVHARRSAYAAAWWVMLLIIPIAVAISRVYRGMHYPSDVAASFIGGFGCLWILQRAMLARAEPSGSPAT
jgi:membrane-associated phospholipid phosphatase